MFQDAIGSVQRGIEVLEFVAGIPHLLKGEFAERAGRNVDALTTLAAGRVRRAVQFPGDGTHVDVFSGAGLWQHVRARVARLARQFNHPECWQRDRALRA